ncbi:hypothetical protein D0Z07_6869 [Hyphodiscus hymeniophilus]|uniref:NAD(P)-binding domain-containing protein n=1 Tax=Hyphodiscus hymeniophilus TaxID=353542 RepID=A0A9P7AVJ1_9HELO|nr:hypothetical protein D0Z07_6869 [Hyphodiscus hymeniophilus]
MSSKLRVLLLGATGNLGLRLIPALLSHNHSIVAYVRNTPKLESLLRPDLLSPLTIVQGDATDTAGMHRAIIENDCDALVCAAGTVVLNPWGISTLPRISEAAADAAILAARDRGGKALRCWFLAGMSLLDYPASTYFLADFVPFGREHIQTMKMLQSKPVDLIKWSILCPSAMRAAAPTPDLKILERPRKHGLLTKADIAPEWRDHLLSVTDLEACADFVAADFESGSMQWNLRRVGVKEKVV